MDIQSFINQAAGSLGVPSADVGVATTGMLGMIQNQAKSDDAKALLSALPGAETILGSMEAQSGGGMMGDLMGTASHFLRGKTRGGLSIVSVFQGANMNPNQAGSFAGMFVDFIQNNADGELVNRILGQVPELRNLTKQ